MQCLVLILLILRNVCVINRPCKYNALFLWFNARNVLKHICNAQYSQWWPLTQTTINYSRLLTKLKAEVPETTLKSHVSRNILSDRSTASTSRRLWIQGFSKPSRFRNNMRSQPICYGACGPQKIIWKKTWWHAMSRYSTLHVTHTMIDFNTHCIMHCILLIYFSITKLYCLLSYTSHYHCSFLSAPPS